MRLALCCRVAAVVMAVMGVAACGSDDSVPGASAEDTRAELAAKLSAFHRESRDGDVPTTQLLDSAEKLCDASAIDGDGPRRVASRAGNRDLDVWMVPMTSGQVALVYGTLARTCGSIDGVLATAREQRIPIQTR